MTAAHPPAPGGGPPPARSRAEAELRRRELAAIHIAARQAGLTDDAYRDMLYAVAGVRSAADLDARGRAQTLDLLRGRRKIPAPAPDKRRLIAKIRALLESRPDAYAEAILQRMTGHPHRAPLAWATPEQLRKVVAALSYDARRKGRRK